MENSNAASFGAGLTESEVRQFQTILREECGVDLSLPEAWSRAIELLSLVEMLLESQGMSGGAESAEFALSPS